MAEKINNGEQDLSEILRVRREKLSALQEEGRDPFQETKYTVSRHAQEIKDRFEELENSEVTVARFDGDFLGQKANTDALKRDFAIVEGLLAEDDAKKGRFASAVDANDADFVAGFDMKTAVIVDDVGTVSELEVGGFHRDYYNIFSGNWLTLLLVVLERSMIQWHGES